MQAARFYRKIRRTAMIGLRLPQAKRVFLISCAALPLLGFADAARPQGWPQKAVRLVVPFPPGGLTDGVARLLGQRLSESLGHPFVIENISGAAGAPAARAVARAPADGYTLLLGSVVQVALLPALGKVAYDPVQDFAPVSNVASTPFVLMIHPSVPANTLKEFVDYVRAQPGKITYASAGIGTLDHLSMALFVQRAGVEMIHVPYKGGPQAITDLLAGHVASYFGNRAVAVQHLNTGKMRLLAVSDEKRSAHFPGVPTVAESGYPRFRTVAWNGLLAPARTPKEIIDKLAHEVSRAVKDQPFIQSLANIGVDPIGDDPQEFAATVAADISAWAEAVKVAGVKDQQ